MGMEYLGEPVPRPRLINHKAFQMQGPPKPVPPAPVAPPSDPCGVAKCGYCGVYGPLGNCQGCGAPNKPVRLIDVTTHGDPRPVYVEVSNNPLPPLFDVGGLERK